MAAAMEEIDLSDLEFHEKIGEGGFGTVSRVTFKNPFQGYAEAAAKSVIELMPEEVEILRKLRHPHIVTLIGFYSNGPINVIVLEYARKGSLYDYLLEHQSTPLPNDLALKWGKEAAMAIEYLHRNSVLHRDIKSNNCLLFEDDLLKLCDFGLAKEMEHSQSTSSQKGTFRYMAPEIHRGNESGRAVYSKAVDVYAYGMLLLEICTREPPFKGKMYEYVVFGVGSGTLKPELPTDFPQDLVFLADLMQKCYSFSPEDRPTIVEVLDILRDK